MQATIEIEQGSKKLKVKMPFHKGSSLTSDASEGGNSVSADDKKKKAKKPETKLTVTVTTTSVSKASKDKKALMTTTTRSNSTGKRGKAPVASDSEQETPKRSRSTGGGKQLESNAQEVTVIEKEKLKSGKKGGPKKKPVENMCAANGTNDVNRLGKGSGGYQPPTTEEEKIIDDWFEKHANKQWKDLLQSLNAEQSGTLHTLLTSGMKQ